jgi:hypothetical protein
MWQMTAYKWWQAKATYRKRAASVEFQEPKTPAWMKKHGFEIPLGELEQVPSVKPKESKEGE